VCQGQSESWVSANFGEGRPSAIGSDWEGNFPPHWRRGHGEISPVRCPHALCFCAASRTEAAPGSRTRSRRDVRQIRHVTPTLPRLQPSVPPGSQPVLADAGRLASEWSGGVPAGPRAPFLLRQLPLPPPYLCRASARVGPPLCPENRTSATGANGTRPSARKPTRCAPGLAPGSGHQRHDTPASGTCGPASRVSHPARAGHRRLGVSAGTPIWHSAL